MKKQFLTAMCAVVFLGLTSCNKNEEVIEQTENITVALNST